MENHENKDKYVKTEKAQELLDVSVLTLHNWANKGKIDTIRTGGGHRLYNVEKYLRDNKNKKSGASVVSIQNDSKTNTANKPITKVTSNETDETDEEPKKIKKENKSVKSDKDLKKDNEVCKEKSNVKTNKENICYIRVSSVGSKNYLKKQKEYMSTKYPEYTIIEDIGSPMNFNRDGLKKIFDLAAEGKINTLVLTNNNNISTYGFEILSHFIQDKFGGKIVIDCPPDDTNVKKDTIDDIMQMMTMCSNKLNELKNSMC